MATKSKDIAALQRSLERERKARAEAEQLLESKSSELYDSNVKLREAQEALEQKVIERTVDLQRTVEELNKAAQERSEALTALRAARDEALRLMNERTDFFARISHDLRTPLNAIVGLIKLLLQEDLENHQLEKLKTIDNSSRVLLSMINEILDFTKIEAGEFKINLIPTDVVGVTSTVIDMLTQEANKKGIPIYMRSRSGIPSQLMLEPMRIEQILINLLNNAVKFTSAGSITVDLDVEEGASPTVKLRVIDTGSGIDPDRLEKIFLPFKQSSEGQLITAGGTGLGLAIVDRLVRLLGGEISVRSKLGEGSTFEVSLPTQLPQANTTVDLPALGNHKRAANAPDTAGVEDAQPTLGSFQNMGLSKPMRILVADDNRVNRELLEMQLSFLGYEADYVSNGEEAIRATLKRNYDLVLMDISMPLIDGEEACRAIRALEEIIQPCIVAVTASAMEGDKERYLDAGMDHYLAKPLDPLALAMLMNEIDRSESEPPGQRQHEPSHTRADLIDMQELEQRLGAMVEPMLLKIAPVFLAELPVRLVKIDTAFNSRDERELTRLLHALKGSSTSTGCSVLAKQCSEAEALTRAGKRLSAEQIATLLSCAKDTGSALKQHIEAAKQ